MKTRNSKLGTIEYGRTAVRPYEQQKGVTLVEMAVVIGIVLILVAIGSVEWNSFDDKGVRNGTLISAKAVGDALRMYQIDKNNQGYTCTLDKLVGYANLTALKKSFTTVVIDSDDCTFNSYTYIRISGIVKGIQPNYIVNYYVDPVKDPECSNGGVAPYLCKDKF